MAPLAAGGQTRGAYRLPTTRRGVLEIGPIHIDDLDPMGLAKRSHRVPSVVRLVVHPPMEALPISRLPSGDDPLLGEELRQSLGMSTEDFDGLREYVTGDDPRRIHWRSTARYDELMVRQYRPPRHGRLTVVIDTRPPSDTEAAQDRTTSVAASIVAAVLAGGDVVRIQTTDGRGTSLLTGVAQLDVALEFLALLDGGDSRIASTVPDTNATVVAVTATADVATDRHVRSRLLQRLRASVVITCDIPRWGMAPSTDNGTREWIHLTGPGQLPDAWRVPSMRTTEVTA